MANKKFTELTAATSMANTDLFGITSDPDGTPASKKITKREALGRKSVALVVCAPTIATETGDGQAYFPVPSHWNGLDILSVTAFVMTAGTTGTLDIQIARVRGGTPDDVLSTKLTIDSTETDSVAAATPAVINTTYDDLETDDFLRIDIDAVHTTAALGLIVSIEVG